ncbi:integrase core domain-containing protein [Chloroflexota bacterium]
MLKETAQSGENGYIERSKGKLRDELLNMKKYTILTKPNILIEQWWREYNQVRPQSVLGYHPSAPEAIIPVT